VAQPFSRSHYENDPAPKNIAFYKGPRTSNLFTSFPQISIYTTMPPQHLSRRAQTTVPRWAGILVLVILVSAALFCILVTILIFKRKRARKQRERKMAEEQLQPFVTQAYDAGAHADAAPEHSAYPYYEAKNQRGVELESNAPAPIELQGGVGPTPQIQRHEVPATGTHEVSPIELPAHASLR
jgi:hypothetical protein